MKKPTEWKKIFENHIFDKRLKSKIYKELTQPNIKKKNREMTCIDSFLKETFRWPTGS